LKSVRAHRPDIVITDVEMPRMTGLDLCQAINEDPDLRHIPVMLVSGSVHPDDPRTDYVGAAAIISKPFHPSELLNTVNSVLSGS
jgi:CheY-like chemotaxis protein